MAACSVLPSDTADHYCHPRSGVVMLAGGIFLYVCLYTV